MNYRFEEFGGIISSTAPPFLAFVDRDYMRSIGLESADRWSGEQPDISVLSAPTEVHFSATNQCHAGCPHCYMNSGCKEAGELTTAEFKRAIDLLAELKVFHIALGGGDALLRDDFFELTEYAREKGLVPNLTISGIGLRPDQAEKLKLLGQVNLSLDGVGEHYGIYRKKEDFDSVDQAFDLLLERGIPAGINCLIGADNVNLLDSLFAYAAEKKVTDIDFLRFKPAGRGATDYHRHKLSNEQNKQIIPRILSLSETWQVASKVDCSFTPMICWHQPPIDELYAMGTYGCEAGNVLLGITSSGRVSGCSFLPNSGLTVFDLNDPAARQNEFARFLHWADQAPMPCRECRYLHICKGGCHAVANFVTGSFDQPDPECPAVVNYNQTGALP